ncbi:transposable element Tcb2 transposase [Trichonephila clavipes]|nr:transposable element Tcb2 transposase [Trichonephila clavipes]
MFSDEGCLIPNFEPRWKTLWRGGTHFHPRNITQRHFPSKGVMVKTRIMLDSHTNVHLFDMGSIIANIYSDENIEFYAHLFRVIVYRGLIFREDNPLWNQAILVDDFLETKNIQHMLCSAHSIDF